MTTILESSRHWDKLAEAEIEMATWEEGHGSHTASAHYAKAESYKKTAKSLRLEADHGEPYCICHFIPRRQCPSGGQGVKP